MSWEAQAWAKSQRVGSSVRKLILILLAERVDETHQCFPSQKLLAREAEMSDRQVRNHLKQLDMDGFIVRFPRFDRGRYTSDLYVLQVPSEAIGKASHGERLPAKGRRAHRIRLMEITGPVCWYCGKDGDEEIGPDGKVWHLDRIQPGSKGGRYRKGNLALSCATCNMEKGALDPMGWKDVDTLEEAFSIPIPEEVIDQRKVSSGGENPPLTSGRNLPVDQRKVSSALEESGVNNQKEQSIEEEMHKDWKKVTGHPTAQLTDSRVSRYRTTMKAMKKMGVKPQDLVMTWGVLMRAVWSNPWRRGEMNRHDPKNILSSPEQRESWIEVAVTELAAGRDGSTQYQVANPGKEHESATDSRKREAVVSRHTAAEEVREAEEDRKAREETEKASKWFLALEKPAQDKVEEEVGFRMVKDFPGVPQTKLLKKAVFLNIWRERTAA